MGAALTACSATGRVRKANEDAAYAGRWLYAVADGMGGHVGGDVASATAIDVLADFDIEADPARLVQVLGDAVTAANTAIRHRGEADPGLRTMGTTLTAMLWSGHTYALAHIGDSRAYRLRGGQLRRLTEDHALRNLVAGSASSKLLAPIMSRFLDGRPDRSPDLGSYQAIPGDRYLLCSDGLTAVVPDPEICAVLASAVSPRQATDRLAGLSDTGGGPDNITVIVVDAASAPSNSSPARLGASTDHGR